MATKIQVRRDTSANWTSANPTLTAGEIGFETDTGKLKVGTGAAAWASLGYFSAAAGISDIPGLQTELDALETSISGLQPLDATLTALAGLSTVAGVLRQSGADTFTKDAVPSARQLYFSTTDGGAAFDDIIVSDVKAVAAQSFLGNEDTASGVAASLSRTEARTLMFGSGAGFDSVASAESDDNVVIYDTGDSTIAHVPPLEVLARGLIASGTVSSAESDDTIVMLDADGTPQRITPANLNVSGSVKARKNSTGSVFERSRLNLIEGTGITLTVGDDAGDDEIDVTVTASSASSAGWVWTDRTETAFSTGTVGWKLCPAITIPAGTLGSNGDVITGRAVGFFINDSGSNQVTRFGMSIGATTPTLWDDLSSMAFSSVKRVWVVDWEMTRKSSSAVTLVMIATLSSVATSAGVGATISGAYGTFDTTPHVTFRPTILEDYAFDCTISNDIHINTYWPTTNAGFTGSYLGQRAWKVSGTLSAGNVANNAVTNAALADVATSTIKGRVTAGTGDPEDLTASQVRTLLNVADGSTAAGATGDAYAASHATAAGAHGSDKISHTATIEGVAGTTVQTALETLSSNKMSGLADPVIDVTTTTWTPTTSTAHGLQIRFSNASPVAITLPSDATQAIVTGRRFTFHAQGAGGISVAAGSGAFYLSGVTTITQNQSLSVVKSGSNTWRAVASTASSGGGSGATFASIDQVERSRLSDASISISPSTAWRVMRNKKGRRGSVPTGVNVISVGNNYSTAPFDNETTAKAFYQLLLDAGAQWVSFRVIWSVIESGASSSGITASGQAALDNTANQIKWAGEVGLDVQFDFHTLVSESVQSWMFPQGTWVPVGPLTGTKSMMNIWSATDFTTRNLFSDYQVRVINYMKAKAGWGYVKVIALQNEPYLFWSGANQDPALASQVMTYLSDQARSVTDKPLMWRFLQDWNPWSWDATKRFDATVALAAFDAMGCNAYSEQAWFHRTVDENVQEGRAAAMLGRMGRACSANGKSLYITECNWGNTGAWQRKQDHFRSFFETLQGVDVDGVFIWCAENRGYSTDNPDNIPPEAPFNILSNSTTLTSWGKYALSFGLIDRSTPVDPPRLITDAMGTYGDKGLSQDYGTLTGSGTTGWHAKSQAPCNISLSATTGSSVTVTHPHGAQPFLPSDLGRDIIELDASGVPTGGRGTMTARASLNSCTINVSSAFSTTVLTRYSDNQARWGWGEYKFLRWAAKRIVVVNLTAIAGWQYKITVPGDVFHLDDWVEVYNIGTASVQFVGNNGMSLSVASGGSLTLPAGTAANPTGFRLRALDTTLNPTSERVTRMFVERFA